MKKTPILAYLPPICWARNTMPGKNDFLMEIFMIFQNKECASAKTIFIFVVFLLGLFISIPVILLPLPTERLLR